MRGEREGSQHSTELAPRTGASASQPRFLAAPCGGQQSTRMAVLGFHQGTEIFPHRIAKQLEP